MEKVTNFTQFEQKITYLRGCKRVYKYTIATVTMHICTVTVACVFNILIIFSLSLSLLSPHLTHPFPHLLSLSPISLFLMPPLPPVKPCLHCRQSSNPHSHLSSFSSCLHYRRSNHASTAVGHQTLTLHFPHLIKSFDKIENKSHSKRELNKKRESNNSFSSHLRSNWKKKKSSSSGFSGNFVPFFFQVWEQYTERRRAELRCVDGCDETKAGDEVDRAGFGLS